MRGGGRPPLLFVSKQLEIHTCQPAPENGETNREEKDGENHRRIDDHGKVCSPFNTCLRWRHGQNPRGHSPGHRYRDETSSRPGQTRTEHADSDDGYPRCEKEHAKNGTKGNEDPGGAEHDADEREEERLHDEGDLVVGPLDAAAQARPLREADDACQCGCIPHQDGEGEDPEGRTPLQVVDEDIEDDEAAEDDRIGMCTPLEDLGPSTGSGHGEQGHGVD